MFDVDFIVKLFKSPRRILANDRRYFYKIDLAMWLLVHQTLNNLECFIFIFCGILNFFQVTHPPKLVTASLSNNEIQITFVEWI